MVLNRIKNNLLVIFFIFCMVNSANATTVRILFAYTPNAATAIGDVQAFAELAIWQANLAFGLSDVDVVLELARVMPVTYTHDTWNDDITRFRTVSDGYMDEIHNERLICGADACVLIINEEDYGQGGTGYGLLEYTNGDITLIDREYAFSVVDDFSANSFYSFSHELGHNFGCRHDIANVDNHVNFPNTYAHGAVSPTYDWITIMSYNFNNGCGASCDVIPYYSTPHKSYNNQVLGNATTMDNHRVLNDQAGMMAGFYDATGSYTIPNRSFTSNEIADYISTSRISTGNTFNILAGADVSLRANDKITLSPGFHMSSGGKFTAKRVSSPLSKKNNIRYSSSNMAIPNKFTLYANYPNPFNPRTTISYDIPLLENQSREFATKLSIYSANGKLIKTLVNCKQRSGQYSVVWNGETNSGKIAPSGIYIYKFESGQFVSSNRMILLK